MTETKTFKNKVDVDSRHNGWAVENWNDNLSSADYEYFSNDEWDMEVTFTRKPREFKVGDRVTHEEGRDNGQVGTVKAVFEQESLWILWDGDSHPWTQDYDDMKHAD